MDNKSISGSCLCGDITFQFTGPIKVFQYCHCSRCQKVTGSTHAANIIIDPDQLTWLSGEELLERYELPNTKHFATTFCKKCGTRLPWLTQSAKAVVIPAGSLDEDPKGKPIHNIFYADKAPWYENVEDLIKYQALPIK